MPAAISHRTFRIRLAALFGVDAAEHEAKQVFRLCLSECRAERIGLYEAVVSIMSATGFSVAKIVNGLIVGAAYQAQGWAYVLAD